MKITSREATVL